MRRSCIPATSMSGKDINPAENSIQKSNRTGIKLQICDLQVGKKPKTYGKSNLNVVGMIVAMKHDKYFGCEILNSIKTSEVA